MVQLLIHLWGDYITQSDWMAQNKTKAHLPAMVHALVYSLPFVFVGAVHRASFNPKLWDSLPLFVIFASHFLIDRYRLARYVVWAKNFIGPKSWSAYPMAGGESTLIYNPNLIDGTKHLRNLPWSQCEKTGYAPTSPDWLAFWLLIIADNTLHLSINYIALRWL
jgi:hypothetical protein